MEKKKTSRRKTINSLLSAKDEVKVFKKIPVNQQGFLLLELPDYKQKNILKALKKEEIVKIIDYLDSEKAVNVLDCLPEKESREILHSLDEEIKKKIEFLLKFNPNTAARLVNLNYLEVDNHLKIKDVLKMVRDYENKFKRFPEILVVENGYFVGELEGQSLFSNPEEKIENYVKKIPSIKYNKEEKEIIEMFKTNPRNQVVVLDEDESIIGVIYSDDILRLISKREGEDLYKFAGIRKIETALDKPLSKVKNRYKWLIINLFTAFLAASVVNLFKETISTFVLLAAYMPIVAGMGGNAGTQTLAVMVRGLALKEVEIKKAKRIIINEIIAGALNGLIIGIIVAIFAVVFNKTPVLGFIIGFSMVTNLMIAGLFGTFIPLLMKKMGKDPATSASIFITTATDVFGFLVFLGLATILL